MTQMIKGQELPYYIAIFSAVRTEVEEGYEKAMDDMLNLVQQMDGFIGVEFAGNEAFSITLVFWRDLQSLNAWRDHPEHVKTKTRGREFWYKDFRVRITKVEADYGSPG